MLLQAAGAADLTMSLARLTAVVTAGVPRAAPLARSPPFRDLDHGVPASLRRRDRVRGVRRRPFADRNPARTLVTATAVLVAATLPASAINAGIALGSLLGGWALTAHGPAAPAGIAIVLTAIALLTAAATSRLHPVSLGAATTSPRSTPPGAATVPVPPLSDDQTSAR